MNLRGSAGPYRPSISCAFRKDNKRYSATQDGDAISLTSLLDDHPEVARRLAKLADPSTFPPRLESLLTVAPRSNRYQMIGRAFDYLLRFEILRRYPNAIAKTWVAESSVERMQSSAAGVSSKRKGTKASQARIVSIGGIKIEELPRYAERASKITTAAKLAVGRYVKDPKPEVADLKDVASHAVRLARVEVFYRAGRIDPEMERVEIEDLEELLALLAIVPFDFLDQHFHVGPVFLNPTFGFYSHEVGGADADIVARNLLIDVKTTKYPDFGKDLAQIIGYGILADHYRNEDASFPEIKEIGFYFSRHGILQTIAYDKVRSHSDFGSAVNALFETARQDFGTEMSETPHHKN